MDRRRAAATKRTEISEAARQRRARMRTSQKHWVQGSPLVRGAGLEPARYCYHQPLKLACLPFHHPRIVRAGRSEVEGLKRSGANPKVQLLILLLR